MILMWRTTEFFDADLANYEELCDLGYYADGCVPVPRPFPDSKVIIEEGEEPPDFYFAGNVRVVSDPLRKTIERFNTKAEFLEVATRIRGTIYDRHQFFILNILDCVACFDYDKSVYEFSDAGVSGIEHLALVEFLATGHHLFQVGPFTWGDECNPKAMNNIIDCVSSELATAILESGATGVTFVKPENWRDYPVQNVAWAPS